VLDKRRHTRFACNLTIEIAVGDERIAARGVDISRGGMCLSTTQALSTPAEVQLELTLVFGSNTFSEPLVLPAKVVWCTRISDEFQVGCMFHALLPEQVRYLEMFLRFLRGEVLAAGDPTAAAEDDNEDDKDPDAEPFG
jgi:hypothetical protein